MPCTQCLCQLVVFQLVQDIHHSVPLKGGLVLTLPQLEDFSEAVLNTVVFSGDLSNHSMMDVQVEGHQLPFDHTRSNFLEQLFEKLICSIFMVGWWLAGWWLAGWWDGPF